VLLHAWDAVFTGDGRKQDCVEHYHVLSCGGIDQECIGASINQHVCQLPARHKCALMEYLHSHSSLCLISIAVFVLGLADLAGLCPSFSGLVFRDPVWPLTSERAVASAFACWICPSATMGEASVQARIDSVEAALRRWEQSVATLQSRSARRVLALQEVAARVQDLESRLTVVETWGMGIRGLSKPPPTPPPRSLVEQHSALAMAAFGISATASSSRTVPCTPKGPPPPSPRRASSRSRSREHGRR
jgi:hypothetical protein